MTTEKTQSPNQICLIRLSALGDCCHALAVIENIRSSSPTSNITWVIGKTEYQLFKDIQGIDSVWPFQQKEKLVMIRAEQEIYKIGFVMNIFHLSKISMWLMEC